MENIIRDALGTCSGCVRDPFGTRSGPVRDAFGTRSGDVSQGFWSFVGEQLAKHGGLCILVGKNGVLRIFRTPAMLLSGNAKPMLPFLVCEGAILGLFCVFLQLWSNCMTLPTCAFDARGLTKRGFLNADLVNSLKCKVFF